MNAATEVSVVQRRDDYRVQVPSDDAAVCAFRFARKFDRPAYTVRLEVCDISAGGLSVADYDQRLADVLGSTVKACTLTLPSHHKPVLVDLQVLRAQEDASRSKSVATRISCQFVRLTDVAGLVIRRYISDLERRQIAQQRQAD